MAGAVYGCSNSTMKLDEVNPDMECEIMVRNNIDEDYVVITDEVIHNNLLYLLKEIISEEKIVISKGGSIPFNYKLFNLL